MISLVDYRALGGVDRRVATGVRVVGRWQKIVGYEWCCASDDAFGERLARLGLDSGLPGPRRRRERRLVYALSPAPSSGIRHR